MYYKAKSYIIIMFHKIREQLFKKHLFDNNWNRLQYFYVFKTYQSMLRPLFMCILTLNVYISVKI